MNKIRIAVAGAGLIGLRHIEEIASSRPCVPSAVVACPTYEDEEAHTIVGAFGSLGVPAYANPKPASDVLATGTARTASGPA
jgi:hypothetical protein